MTDREQTVEDLVTFTLKKCPFCGSDAVMEFFSTALEKKPRFRVRCSSCWCQTDWEAWNAEEAAKRWNAREGANNDA